MLVETGRCCPPPLLAAPFVLHQLHGRLAVTSQDRRLCTSSHLYLTHLEAGRFSLCYYILYSKMAMRDSLECIGPTDNCAAFLWELWVTNLDFIWTIL